MTTENPNPLFQLQAQTGQNYIALLNEIQAMGVKGFLEFVDKRSEDELHMLLGACDVVFQMIQRAKMQPLVTPPEAPKVG